MTDFAGFTLVGTPTVEYRPATYRVTESTALASAHCQVHDQGVRYFCHELTSTETVFKFDLRLNLRDFRFTLSPLEFIVLGIFWMTHHSLFHFVRRVNRGLLWFNLLFLLFITRLPFSTNLLSGHSSLHIPVAVYGANLLLLSLTSLLQLRYLALRRHRHEK